MSPGAVKEKNFIGPGIDMADAYRENWPQQKDMLWLCFIINIPQANHIYMNFITKIEIYVSLLVTELGLKFYASDRAICVSEWG